MIDIPMAVVFALIIGAIAAHGHNKWTFHRTKRLYVSEIKCPKCEAAPGLDCKEMQYRQSMHLERWDACNIENLKRDKIRESKVKTGQL